MKTKTVRVDELESEALDALIELQTRVQTVGRGYENADSAARCQELFATIRAAFAANWERVRELEQMLKRFINADSFRVDASVPYPDAPFGDTTERLMAARKLLEKGNE